MAMPGITTMIIWLILTATQEAKLTCCRCSYQLQTRRCEPAALSMHRNFKFGKANAWGQAHYCSHFHYVIFAIFRLIRLLHKYARENLLLANIYIKDPAVTMIRRDQKIPIIWFVANVGGILGLCMGCSLVTLFEVLHHIILIFLRTSVKSVSRIHKTIRCAPRYIRSHFKISSSVVKSLQYRKFKPL